jgi:hypothetical protein
VAQIFSPTADTWLRAVLIALVVGTVGSLLLAGGVARSQYVTEVARTPMQPVPFSHKHHAGELGIDCRYCHTSVERSAFAGLPPTETCMNCHRQIWTNAELLEPIRASYRDNVPVQWTRVNNVPDFVYFNHSVHVAKGIGCQSCHGNVDRMPLMFQNASLQMQWCLDCHRNPTKNVRPREEVFNMNWNPGDRASFLKYMPSPREAANPHWEPSGQDVARLQAKLAKDYELKSLTSCSTCHR